MSDLADREWISFGMSPEVQAVLDSLVQGGFYGITRHDAAQRIVERFCEQRIREGDLLPLQERLLEALHRSPITDRRSP